MRLDFNCDSQETARGEPLKCLQQLQALTMELCRAGGCHSARLFGVAVPSSGLTCLSGLSILSNEPAGFITYVDVYLAGEGSFLVFGD